MAKAKKVESIVTSGMQAKDLSLEKRVELYNKEYEKFKNDMSEQYGLTLDVELIYHPKGTMPRMVIVDLLAKKNEQAKENQG